MNNILKKILIAGVSIALTIFSINAFAHSERGWGHHGWGHYGIHHQEGYYPGNANRMSPEEYEKFEQKREAFFRETQGIRDELFEKNRELDNELAKAEPDAARASQLQKDISALQSQFDQKRIEFMVEMRKLNPNAGRGTMYGNRMMGDRSYRGGYCWE